MTPTQNNAPAGLSPGLSASRSAVARSSGTSSVPPRATAPARQLPGGFGCRGFSQRMVALSKAHAAVRQPVAAHGWWWPSQKDAADAMGVKDYVVTRALQRGRFDALVLAKLGVRDA